MSDTVKVRNEFTAVGAAAFPSRSSTAPNGRPTETGIIPTAGISVGGKQYLNYMSIKSWDANGAWTTNYSAIAVSPDNGDRWGVYPGSVRTPRENAIPGARHAPGNENFQQGAFLKPGPGDPYIYSFGTPSGRSGSAYVVARSPDAICRTSPATNTGTPTKTPGFQPIRGLRRR